jgi:hypothetical protein
MPHITSHYHGFMIVEMTSDRLLQSCNPLYRGIFRELPWTDEMYDPAWRDPEFCRPPTPDNLFHDPVDALRSYHHYLQIVRRSPLELLYIDNRQHSTHSRARGIPLKFLGVDLAQYQPYAYSIVAGWPCPPGTHAACEVHRRRLNHNGLFDTWEHALEYRDYFLREVADCYQAQRPWQVFLVTPT